ncbi:MAG TPA: cyclic nucleotide-binding domain-containing protein [Anaerolineaceae bacterium]|nr:cyclic nucleotide-binding domain-containing protein [Anaerolineaceae bacterium]HPN52481.1 cyclic nucleotide-binding domain-containing protein [Anaerolineaceae bacterium]
MFRDIPPAEVEQFRSFMYVYSRGATLLTEGEQDDRGLFLLRKGKVNIFKNTGSGRDLISTIEAINFFGEMAIIVGGARSATVVAESDEVVVYAFRKPDLTALMKNPKWSLMLVTRLCSDLKNANEQLTELRGRSRKLQEVHDRQTREMIEIFSLISEVQNAVAQEAVVTSREWYYLKSLAQFTRKVVRAHFPEITERVEPLDPQTWQRIRAEGLLSADLEKCMEKYASKST